MTEQEGKETAFTLVQDNISIVISKKEEKYIKVLLSQAIHKDKDKEIFEIAYCEIDMLLNSRELYTTMFSNQWADESIMLKRLIKIYTLLLVS